MKWNIADKKGSIIAQGSIPYEEVLDHSYTDIEVNTDVRLWHRYYINISFDRVNDIYPKMILNHGEERIWGGKRLFCNGEYLKGMNFVWAIRYGEDILLEHKVPALVFSMAAVMVFFLKDKWKPWMKIIIALAAFFILSEYLVYYGECAIDGPAKWPGDVTLYSNCKILYLLIIGLFLLSQSPRWSLRTGSIITGILYIADFYVLRFRGSSLKIWDIMSIGTAKEVAGNYSYKISGDILALIALLLFIWSISYSFPVMKCKVKYRMLIGTVGIIYCISLGHAFLQDSFWNRLEGVDYTTAFFGELNYRSSGYLASFLYQIKESRVEKPENYKQEEVKSILAGLEESKETKGKKPHIIVVVNESLADLMVLGDISSEEPLTYMKSLRENTVKGYINVSVLGGGTSNSEFEFLTGNSMAHLPQGYYPFNVMNKQQESMLWDLQKMGYETYGMHPSAAANWNRETIYPLLGFQHCYWSDIFEDDAEKVHFGVSDKETYQKIIQIFENRKQGEVQFIYDMTIQNHGGYSEIDVDEVIENPYLTVSEYLSLVRCSDEALKELVEYFKNQPEDVIICIFGDHQPVLEEGFYEDIFMRNGI